MLPIALIVGTLLVVFVISVVYMFKGSNKSPRVPGLDPTSKEAGNLDDVANEGNMHIFLSNLHKRFGPIASFWWGPHMDVSIANAELFKEHQKGFDRPPIMFPMTLPLFGSKSITHTNGEDAKARRRLYDKCFTHSACAQYIDTFLEAANEVLTNWEAMVGGEHVPVSEYMFAYTLKASLVTLFGEQIKNDNAIFEFKRFYDLVWEEMTERPKELPDDERKPELPQERMKVKAVVKRLITIRKKNPPKRGEELFLDLVLEGTEDDERQFDDVVTYMVAGFHTTGNGLCWAMYFLAKHQDCQDKLAAELKDVLGGAKLDHTNLGELKYLQQVIDETLRYAILLPFTARVQDFDQELGGYMVPKNTPVIHALGVALADETAFPHPEKFDPERFTKDTARERSSLAFSPFGFAGKRSCPGKRFANVEIAVALAVLLQKVKVTLVEGQNIKQVNGFVTHPNEEIWITLSKR